MFWSEHGNQSRKGTGMEPAVFINRATANNIASKLGDRLGVVAVAQSLYYRGAIQGYKIIVNTGVQQYVVTECQIETLI